MVSKTITITKDKPFIQHMKDVPHCKFLKYTVTSTGGSYLEHATIASLFS